MITEREQHVNRGVKDGITDARQHHKFNKVNKKITVEPALKKQDPYAYYYSVYYLKTLRELEK